MEPHTFSVEQLGPVHEQEVFVSGSNIHKCQSTKTTMNDFLSVSVAAYRVELLLKVQYS